MYTKVMMLSAVLVGIAFLNTIQAMPNPGVHHTQGQKITHVHHYGDGNQQGGGGTGGGAGAGGGAGDLETVISSTENTATNTIDNTITNTIDNTIVNGGGAPHGGNGGGSPHGGNGGGAPHGGNGGGAPHGENGGGAPHVIHIHTNTGAGTGGNAGTVIKNTVDDISGSHDIKMGVRKNERCKSGLLDETTNNLASALHGGVNGLNNVIHKVGGGWLGGIGNALNTLGDGAAGVLNHAVEGVDSAANTMFCGLGDMANAAANGLDNGDVLGAVDSMGSIFFGGLASMGEDVLSSAANGLGSGVSGITGALGQLLG